MEEKKTITLTSMEQLNDFLKERGDELTIVSIELEITGESDAEEEGNNG